jgi:hypothetical protein
VGDQPGLLTVAMKPDGPIRQCHRIDRAIAAVAVPATAEVLGNVGVVVGGADIDELKIGKIGRGIWSRGYSGFSAVQPSSALIPLEKPSIFSRPVGPCWTADFSSKA